MPFQDRGQSLGNKRLPRVERDPNSGFWFDGLLHFRFHGILAVLGPHIYRTSDRGALAAAIQFRRLSPHALVKNVDGGCRFACAPAPSEAASDRHAATPPPSGHLDPRDLRARVP